MKKIVLSILVIGAGLTAKGQNVGIGTNAPDASAKLQIEDNNRGVMITRVSLVDVTNGVTPVNAPLTGLLVFNTNAAVTGGSGTGFYYWDGAIWQRLQSGNGDHWDLLGNGGTNPNVNFLGTTDNQALVFRTNSTEAARVHTNQNVSIGSVTEVARLHVETPSANTTETTNIYAFHNGANTGTTYAIRNYNSTSTNSTKYGIYNNVNNEGTGARYGIYNLTYMNSGAGASTGYGGYNYLNSYGTGNHRALYNYLYHSGTDVSASNYASYNYTGIATSTNTSTLYGEYTEVDYSTGIRYGEAKEMNTNATYSGTVYSDYNYIGGTGNDLIHGVYVDVPNTGTGTHYGVYSNVPGGTNDFAAFFNAGNVVSNEVGGDYDFRIESVNRTSALHVDAANDVVRIGLATGSLNGNGGTYGGAVANYVADFDAGGATGTTIGIGSIEFLIDGSSRTLINNEFDPTSHIIYDLGFSTTAEAWDDVYADDFWNVSDIRAKKDVTDMKYGLNEILKFKTISYTLINDPFGDKKIGVIAQDALNLVPEAVKTHDYKITDESKPGVFEKVELDRYGVNYGSLVPVLIKATQEQQEIIEAQNEKIDAIQRELDEIKKLLQK